MPTHDRIRSCSFPITNVRTANQSNEIYPPPLLPRRDSTFVWRPINAIRQTKLRSLLNSGMQCRTHCAPSSLSFLKTRQVRGVVSFRSSHARLVRIHTSGEGAAVKTLPLTEAKSKLSSLVERVHALDEEIVITKNGRPAAVLVSPEEFESWKETTAIRSDPTFMKEIRAGLAALKARKAKLYTLVELLG